MSGSALPLEDFEGKASGAVIFGHLTAYMATDWLQGSGNAKYATRQNQKSTFILFSSQ